MEKTLKKSIVILMITAILLSFNVVNANATEDSNQQSIYSSEALNIDLKNSIKRSTYNQLLSGNTDIGSSYDISRKYDVIVKNQQLTNTCWAFAYTSAIETTIKDNKEYSPMHVEYSMTDLYNKELGNGGNFIMALSYAASECGPVYEDDLKFESVYDPTKNSPDTFFLTDTSKVSLDNLKARARIEDVSIYPQIYKTYDSSNNTVKYKNSNEILYSKTYTDSEVTAIRNLIKKQIKENGAVVASFYTDIKLNEDDEFVSLGGYYDTVNKSYCSKGNGILFSKQPNHAVTIIGWDDNYSKENFKGTDKPINNGAYIVLNSYGKEFGNNGIFYVSYDDYAIEQQILGIGQISKVSDSKEVKYRYEYDEIGMNNCISVRSGFNINNLYGANVFSRKDKKHVETLNEVGIYLDRAEGVEIYVNPENDNLTNCKLVGSYTGDKALEAGYHVVKLSSPVELTGDKFVVKIKYINKEGPAVPLEYNFKTNNVKAEEMLVEPYKNVKSNAGESFISFDDKTWDDIYNLKVGTDTYKDSNICIKAFTVQGDEKVPVTGIELDKKSVSIQVGDKANLVAKVKPTNAYNKNVTWKSSDTKVATISNDGVITAKAKGKTTITVTTDDGKFTATCEVTVNEKQTSANDIYKDDEKDKETDKNKNEASKDESNKDNNKDEANKNNDKNKDESNKNTNNNEQNKNDKPNNSKPNNGQAEGPLPQTGVTSIIGIIAISGIIVFIIYRKNKKYKGLK